MATITIQGTLSKARLHLVRAQLWVLLQCSHTRTTHRQRVTWRASGGSGAALPLEVTPWYLSCLQASGTPWMSSQRSTAFECTPRTRTCALESVPTGTCWCMPLCPTTVPTTLRQLLSELEVESTLRSAGHMGLLCAAGTSSSARADGDSVELLR